MPGSRWFVATYTIVTADYSMTASDLLRFELVPADRAAIAQQVAAWIKDPVYGPVVMSVYARVHGPAIPTSAGHQQDAVAAGLASAFQQGRLHMLRERRHWSGGGSPGPEPRNAGGAPPPRSRSEKTWIEVQLINDRDEPMPGVRYRLKVTDGSVREGTLDERGCCRAGNIDPGNCTLWFPDLDGEDWQAR